jgi:hypothetical protein
MSFLAIKQIQVGARAVLRSSLKMGKDAELEDGGHRQGDRLHHRECRCKRGIDASDLCLQSTPQVTGVIFSRNLVTPKLQ